jgi:hypothetical protein
MSDVLNLNRFRKRQQRDDAREQADRNRVVHGRSKAEKQLARLERERAQQLLEGHRISPTADEESIDGLASDDGEDDSTPEPE